MESFKYIARDTSGVRREGIQRAVSSNDVLSSLREQGFTPISISAIVKKEVKKTKQKARRKRIKSADLAALCWQMTTMVEGGIPITTALATISEDIENMYLQQVLQQILDKMNKGATFSDSVADFPRVFNQLCVAIILAGETGGNIVDSLRRLAEYFDTRDKLMKKVKAAMAYPIFVVVFIVLIVVFIMTFIIPRFRTIFDQLGNKLPAFTQGFMNVYDFICGNIHYILGFILLASFSASFAYSKTKKGHYWFCRLALKLPLLGKILAQAFIVVFCRTMSTLIGAGVSVLEVLEILTVMASNDIIRAAVTKTRENIVSGSSISSSLASAGFFPNMVIKMVQVGEQSGSLSKTLEQTADYYERKVDALITVVMSLLEPVLIVTVGAIVLVVILALYLPIFSMSNV